ncbi:MAG: DoxX family protein, partial [Flavitalea sp.]
GFKTKQGLKNDRFQYPSQPGIKGVAGIYNVSKFAINTDTLGYSKTDPLRWTDLVFEEWNTISIRSNRPVILDSGNVDKVSSIDSDRAYEFEGSGGRHYYSYQFDSASSTLNLTNRNPHYKGEVLKLKYERPDDSTIVLSGTNENNQPVFAELRKINKKYLLEEVARRGRRKSFKL